MKTLTVHYTDLALVTSVQRLATMPRLGRPALEQERITYELRQLTVKSHRIMYTIRGRRIVGLRVRHAAQDELSAVELEPPPRDEHA